MLSKKDFIFNAIKLAEINEKFIQLFDILGASEIPIFDNLFCHYGDLLFTAVNPGISDLNPIFDECWDLICKSETDEEIWGEIYEKIISLKASS